ncbi:MAG: hypothetical protein AAF467_13240 [Actinomycetota bacterium]
MSPDEQLQLARDLIAGGHEVGYELAAKVLESAALGHVDLDASSEAPTDTGISSLVALLTLKMVSDNQPKSSSQCDLVDVFGVGPYCAVTRRCHYGENIVTEETTWYRKG